MSIDINKIDLLLQYVLLAAGDEDDYMDRQLGPIHLIKYVYLADLNFAKRNDGQSFTGIEWYFYKFGPWSQAVNERIESALASIHANKYDFESHYGKDDWVRWDLRDARLLEEKENALPALITANLKRAVHNFGKDTPRLLDYVYKTQPMLSAAPNEFLDLSLAVDTQHQDIEEDKKLRMDGLSNRKRKRFKQKMVQLREAHQSRKSKQPELVNPVPRPRYDEIYEQGVSWLESLSGEPFTEGEMVLEFSEEVWNSTTRKGDEFS